MAREISNPNHKPEEIVVMVQAIGDAERSFRSRRSQASHHDKYHHMYEPHLIARLANQKRAQDALRTRQFSYHQGNHLLGKLTNVTNQKLTADMAAPALDRMLDDVKREELQARTGVIAARQAKLEPQWQAAAQEISDFMNQLVDKYDGIAANLNANRGDINKTKKALTKEIEAAEQKLIELSRKYKSDPTIRLEIQQIRLKIDTMSIILENYIHGVEVAAANAGVRGLDSWDVNDTGEFFEKKADEAFKQYGEFDLQQYKVSKDDLFNNMQESFKFDEQTFSAAYENQLNIHQAELKLLLIEQQKIIKHEMEKNNKTLDEARVIAAQQTNVDEVIQAIRLATLKQLRQEDNEEFKALVDTVKENSKEAYQGYERQKALKDETIRRYLLGDWESNQPVSDEDAKRLDEDRVVFANGIVAERYEGGMTFTLPKGYTEKTVDAMAAIMRNIYDVSEDDQISACPALSNKLMKASAKAPFFNSVGLAVMSRPNPETPETKSVLRRVREGLSDAGTAAKAAVDGAATAVGKKIADRVLFRNLR